MADGRFDPEQDQQPFRQRSGREHSDGRAEQPAVRIQDERFWSSSSTRFGDGNVYAVEDLLGDLHKGIWKELGTHQPITVWRRNLQKTYVESLISILNPAGPPSGISPGLVIFFGPNTRNTDLPSIVRAELVELRAQIQASLPMTTDRLSKYHLEDLAERIRRALNPR